MPAASFFSSASSFFSCSSRDARADWTRCWFVRTLRAAVRTCVTTCSSMFLSCACAWSYSSFTRARFACAVFAPSG